MKFEINVGKFDLAAMHLKMLLQKEPAEEVDRELSKSRPWRDWPLFLLPANYSPMVHVDPTLQEEADKNVKSLLGRVTAALEKYLSDPVRLNKFIKNLDAGTIEERGFRPSWRSNVPAERAVPYLVEALRTQVGTPLHGRIVEAMYRLDPEIVAPLLETLKAANPKDAPMADLDSCASTILDIVKKRADKQAVPYLWHLSSSRMYPAQIRDKCQGRAGLFPANGTGSLCLPACAALTELAGAFIPAQ